MKQKKDKMIIQRNRRDIRKKRKSFYHNFKIDVTFHSFRGAKVLKAAKNSKKAFATPSKKNIFLDFKNNFYFYLIKRAGIALLQHLLLFIYSLSNFRISLSSRFS